MKVGPQSIKSIKTEQLMNSSIYRTELQWSWDTEVKDETQRCISIVCAGKFAPLWLNIVSTDTVAASSQAHGIHT